MAGQIPHSRPTLGEAEAEAAAAIVRSGAVAQGAQVMAFEQEMAHRLGRAHAVAVSSGTAALALTLQALGVDGGQVVMPSYVCSALSQAALHARARPWLVDVDEGAGNISDCMVIPPDARAILVPHMFGVPSPVFSRMTDDTPIVEDLAMALGSDGVGTGGIASICSFYATKVITSGGEGGMVVADDEGLIEAIRQRRQYDGLDPKVRRWNAKLTEVAAAIGRVQLRRLDEFVGARRPLAEQYRTTLRGSDLRLPAMCAASNDYRFVVGLPAGRPPVAVIDTLEAQGISCRRPVDRPLHRWFALTDSCFPVTTQLWEQSLSLPIYPSLPPKDVERVCQALMRVLDDRGRA